MMDILVNKTLNKTLNEHRACPFLTAAVIVPHDSNCCMQKSKISANSVKTNKDITKITKTLV